MKLIFYIGVLLSLNAFLHAQEGIQSDALAKEYYKNGEFEKALISYQRLLKEKPYNFNYIYNLIDTHQQLKQYDEAEDIIKDYINRLKAPVLYIELGYNYQLQDSLTLAKENYDIAISSLESNPNFVYSLSRKFEDHSLLDEAIRTYTRADELLPDKSFYIQLARIYGEQGNVELMFSNYLNYIPEQPNFMNNVKRDFNDFVTEDSSNKNNQNSPKITVKEDSRAARHLLV